MTELLLTTFIFLVGFNILMFIPAYFFKTDKLTDISYSISFVAAAIFLYINSAQNIVHLILLIMILLWAIRLGTYLLIRINKTGKDDRFDKMRESFFGFLKFWLLQGISVWVIMLAASVSFATSNIGFSSIHILGLAIWLIGLIIETVADYQKFKFKNNPENSGKWTNVGLWRKSRHPNYFGEMLIWIGIFIYCAIYSTIPNILIELISPIYIITLLLFVSGVPILEKKYNERYKDNPEYQKYKEETNLIIVK
jgi:steroid 5-alpha reductase family enzyme